MKQRGDRATGTRVRETWVNSSDHPEILYPEYLMLEAVDITTSAVLGSEKAFAMLEQLDIPIEYRAKVAALMRLFEEIQERARKIFDPHPGRENPGKDGGT
jgi:hypothetical protein